MSNLIASQKVMKHYLSALLTEDAEADAVVQEEQKKQQLNALLAQAVVSAPEEKRLKLNRRLYCQRQ